MGYRSSRRPRKFYQQQVTQVLALLDNYFREDQLPLETYLSMCEQLGKDWSALEMLLTVLEIIERRQCILFIKHIEARNSNKINKELARERKKAENKAKRR